ncbi:MAG: hypothetical protein ACOC4E_03200 [Patescibacteria group bacterium]
MSLRFSVLPNVRHPQSPAGAGFGLIELLVSVSIMALVSGIILARQGGFNSAVLLRSEAYSMALTIRDVQLSAVSAMAETDGSTANYRQTRGVHFETSSSLNQIYQPYTDQDDNDHFSSSDTTGLPERLDSRFEIRSIMTDTGSATSSQTALSITFDRPNFDARFYDEAGTELGSVVAAEIVLSRAGVSGGECGIDYRVVRVTRTGQVSVPDCS